MEAASERFMIDCEMGSQGASARRSTSAFLFQTFSSFAMS